jgi:hypothetical protein
MDPGNSERPRRPASSTLSEGSTLVRRNLVMTERGAVEVQGETIGYDLHAIDARSNDEWERDARRGRPDGNILVVIPGHGQGIHGPKKLLASAALLSRSKIAWCIDPTPAKGGDRTEAQAIARVVRERVSATFPESEEPVAATLIGWSHGGSEALRAADCAPDLFPQYLGLCPSGLVDRQPLELLYSFSLEATRILWASVRRRDWTCLVDTLRLGLNAAAGSVRDLWRSRSPRRLIEDIGWASGKVPGIHFGYPGEIVFLFGAQDTVVRWQDAFPECDRPQDISTSLGEFRRENFPSASRVGVRVIKGAHVAPEADAPSFLEPGLRLLGQLDERVNSL